MNILSTNRNDQKKDTPGKVDKAKDFLSKNKPKRSETSIGYAIIGAILLFGLIDYILNPLQGFERAPINQVISLINEDKVQEITVSGDDLKILLKDGTTVVSKKEANVSFDEILSNGGADRSKVKKVEVVEKLSIGQIVTGILSFGIPLVFLFFIYRQFKSTSTDVFSFGRSKAKLFNKELSKTTFKDVAGNEEAKKDMEEIVDFLKFPKKYQALGARVPKGVLLVGPSGVGKTLLAKAIAGEADVPFFSVAGSEFMEMLVGVGSSRVRDLFDMARATQPSLIFIDEIDAIGRQRGYGMGGGHDEREQTLNQILIEMDGFGARTNVIVIAATNRPDMLDPALVRAGRFDRRISLSLPDLEDRKEIIKIHMRGKPFASDFNLDVIAKKTVGFSGADIENMLNEAAISAARVLRKEITQADVEEASLKVTMGPEKRRRMSDPEDLRNTAYHEAGHAIVGAFSKGLDPIGRVTIVPRGGSLGHTYFPPEKDRYNETKTRLLSMLRLMLGGRAAEEIMFNEQTTGAANDLEKATELARKMVTEYGMSDLGAISFDGLAKNSWLDLQMTGSSNVLSQDMASKVDTEIKKLIDQAFSDAKTMLSAKKQLLELVAKALLEKETLDNEEFTQLITQDGALSL